MTLLWLGVQSVLDPAGPQAGQIFQLGSMMFWICAVVWVLVVAYLLAVLLRGKREGDDQRAVRWVTGLTILTTLILLGILTTSALTGRSLASATHNELNINVTGHQWWWEFEYPDGPPFEHFTTANEIHIPTGRAVRIHTTSQDVIHSFWAPNLQGKLDAIPTRWNTAWLQADTAGTYRGQCAEFCGLQHAKMAFMVVAEAPDKFEAWQAQQRAPASNSQARGREVFMRAPCVICHTIQGTEAHATVGPNLTHVGSRSTIAAAALSNTPTNMAAWIVNSKQFKPGNKMPAMNLPKEDVEPLVAYLESLR